MMILEIYTDASMRTFEDGRTFGCSGALCATNGMAKYTINPDSTNNRSELLAVFLGVQLANEIIMSNPGVYDQIDIYSDSQFSIFGLTRWINSWIKTKDSNGIIYGSNNRPVKNQEIFAMILTYMVDNNLKVRFLHQAGHIRVTSLKRLGVANYVFKRSNGYSLRPDEVYKISYYNDIVDRTTRSKLYCINPNNFPKSSDGTSLAKYDFPMNYRKCIRK